MVTLPLSNTVTNEEEGDLLGDKVAVERDAQIQLEQVLEARVQSMRDIVAQHARDYNAMRLRGDKKHCEALNLQAEVEALERAHGHATVGSRRIDPLTKRNNELAVEFERADDLMYAAMHDTETYDMMTKRLLETVDFLHVTAAGLEPSTTRLLALHRRGRRRCAAVDRSACARWSRRASRCARSLPKCRATIGPSVRRSARCAAAAAGSCLSTAPEVGTPP